jgi:uncharacterized protein YeaO (DUF488 family)
MIQTSYFANFRNFPENKKKISISRFTPKWFKEDYNALELAPSAELLKDYKDGLVDDAEYDKRYKKETLDKLDPKEIAKKYKDSIFLCYETDKEFCHRQLVANWLRENGENVEEVVKDIRIAIIGSRSFDNYEYFKKVISKLIKNYKNFSFVSGGAKGADLLAERYAKEFNIEIIVLPAKWYIESKDPKTGEIIQKYDKSAGFKRNYEIWKIADIGIAFWDGKSKGTSHSFDLAKKQNKKLYIANYKTKKIEIN